MRYKPCVLVLTCGEECEGDFQKGVAEFKSHDWRMCFMGRIGDDSDCSDLRSIYSGFLNPLRGMVASEAIPKFFEWGLFRIVDYVETRDEYAIIHGESEQEEDMLPLHVHGKDVFPEDVKGETCESNLTHFDRRMPIYLVVDVSKSMDGAPIQEVYNAIQQLVAELNKDPRVLDTAWISIITFGDGAEQIVPLTELESFEIPELQIRNEKTNLGEALNLLVKCYDRDVRKPDASANFMGDFAPLVFVFTDGKDDVGDLDKGIRDFKSKKWEAYVFCAVGPDADLTDLKRINSEAVIKLGNIQAGTLAKYFWRHDEDSIKICSSPLRKNLVAYIAVDMSETMSGLPLEAIQFGLKQLAHDLCQFNSGPCGVQLGVVGFNDDAAELLEPTVHKQVALPPMEAKGRANIGKGLTTLSESARRNDANLALPPILFILSADGRATEAFEEGLSAFKQQKWGSIVACAMGGGADIPTLKRIEPKNVIRLKDLRPATILRFFDWIFQSIQFRLKDVEKIDSATERISQPL